MESEEKTIAAMLLAVVVMMIVGMAGTSVFNTIADREIQLDRNQKMLEAVKAWAK